MDNLQNCTHSSTMHSEMAKGAQCIFKERQRTSDKKENYCQTETNSSYTHQHLSFRHRLDTRLRCVSTDGAGLKPFTM